MSLWIGSRSEAADDHGVFVEERSLPALVTPIGTGTVGLVGQFPWGPVDQVIEPADTADRLSTIAPLGMDRTGPGYMAALGKAWPDLRIVRVLGTSATAASAPLQNAVPTTITNVAGKYKGVAGNSMIAVVSAATDGDADHFNLSVSVTNAQGSTIEDWQNINFSGVGADSVVDCSASKLVASVTKAVSGRPVNGTYSFASGTDGTINSLAYLGTPEAGDLGLALFEGQPDVDIVFADDCGNSLRAAVNAGLKAHAVLLGDRIAVLNGDSGQTALQARTAAALNQSVWAAFVDCWYFQRDDSGVERLCSPAAALAVIMANLPASTSPAWKAREVRELIGFITRVQYARGAQAKLNARGGVCTIIKEATGGHSFHAAVNTAAPVAPAKKNLTRSRMGIYIAKSIKDSLRESVDAPNVPVVQGDVISAIQMFMSGLKDAKGGDPKHQAHVVDWGWLDLASANPQSSVQAGDFTAPFQVTTSAAMERIYPSIEYGENVVVKAGL